MLSLLYFHIIDELARRGIKRPFNSSTEDELNNHVPVVQVSPSARSFQQERLRPNESRTFTEISPIGRRGLGDHFKQLLHHLGNKQSGFIRQCYACHHNSPSTSFSTFISCFLSYCLFNGWLKFLSGRLDLELIFTYFRAFNFYI